MTVDKRAVAFGMFLIMLGVVFLFINTADHAWERWWPLLPLTGGLAFFVFFVADRRNYGVLMPGAILSIYGILFLYCAHNGWHHISELWPTFILGPGVGLLLMYAAGSHDVGLLIPAAILIGLSSVFFIAFGPFRMYRRYWPVLLIAAGIIILLAGRKPPQTNLE